jgi:hypothetical protein
MEITIIGLQGLIVLTAIFVLGWFLNKITNLIFD